MKKPIAKSPQEKSIELKSLRDAILTGIQKGEKDIEDGKVYTHAQAKEKLKKWLQP